MLATQPAIFTNPLADSSRQYKTAEPCVMVIFGATGDLTARRLFPALYNLAREGLLPSHFAVVGFARKEKSHAEFRQEMLDAVNKHSRVKPVDPAIWHAFSEQIFYQRSEFDREAGYDDLNQLLKNLDRQFGTRGNRVFYLSTQPSFFADIIGHLSNHNLIYKDGAHEDKWSRVIIEKPFGHDLSSAIALQKDITQFLDESQIYRIDHWLGKETVQNLLTFRFSNPIFESIWNNKYIDHVQITVSEELGIGSRGRFFEEAGMLRDIVQNHMMQLLSLVAMEPSTDLGANSIRDEKVKVMHCVRGISEKDFDKHTIRGQYGPGYIQGTAVPGYREEENVAKDSSVETYVALELFVDNWRWAGVPFFLRAGKRLPKRATEIVIVFKEVPRFLFQSQYNKIDANILVIRIQPDEGISLKMNCKVPGLSSVVQPVKMDFRYTSYFGGTPPEAYERLICDCMSGDSTLFARVDEVLASWKLFDPLIKHWASTPAKNFPNYQAGTWGPPEADALLGRENRQWRLL